MGKAVRRGLWSPDEDQQLATHVLRMLHEGAASSWTCIPRQTGLQRCGKSCRFRWMNYLRPGLKRGIPLSKQEQDFILQLHHQLGNRWSDIAAHLPGRTNNEVKNFCNKALRKFKTNANDKTNSQSHQEVLHVVADDDQSTNTSSHDNNGSTKCSSYPFIIHEDYLKREPIDATTEHSQTNNKFSIQYDTSTTRSAHILEDYEHLGELSRDFNSTGTSSNNYNGNVLSSNRDKVMLDASGMNNFTMNSNNVPPKHSNNTLLTSSDTSGLTDKFEPFLAPNDVSVSQYNHFELMYYDIPLPSLEGILDPHSPSLEGSIDTCSSSLDGTLEYIYSTSFTL